MYNWNKRYDILNKNVHDCLFNWLCCRYFQWICHVDCNVEILNILGKIKRILRCSLLSIWIGLIFDNKILPDSWSFSTRSAVFMNRLEEWLQKCLCKNNILVTFFYKLQIGIFIRGLTFFYSTTIKIFRLDYYYWQIHRGTNLLFVFTAHGESS